MNWLVSENQVDDGKSEVFHRFIFNFLLFNQLFVGIKGLKNRVNYRVDEKDDS